MRVLVIGAGLVGTAAGARLRSAGHHVTGTTTTPARVEDLRRRFDDVVVLRGTDRAAVARHVADADAVVVTAGPAAARAMTPEDRAATYHEVLVETALSVTAAGAGTHLVALSALSVYGNACDHLDEVTEDAPVTSDDDPSPRMFLAMEQVYRDTAGDRLTIFRCGDVFGADDPPIEAKVALAHTHLGGSVPFGADALFYRLSVDDAADAVLHAVQNELVGVFNLTHPEVPPRNAELFDTIAASQGLEPLVYRAEIAAPSVPVSTRRLAEAGFVAERSYVPHPLLAR
ncbi:nucleoside-diphosphate-sugar epimerase [Mumia flava]|uniref:Nucleoside-diphosphate-sugar epimerase n=1 Tax=Mumia flava TaxID=1348852 RepID=A0A0B2BGF4_9ACTN|nr:NAD-dependent epimerase/dehydratase family protein [Mumia flava]PJJ56350.1 nucleoside-diphosphate-sugar epimerase [Mumia flava]